MEALIYKFFNWEIMAKSAPYLLDGAWTTIKLTLLAEVLSVVVGLICAMIRVSRLPVIKAPIVFYVDLFRATPLLVQIIIIFYALPDIGILLGRYEAAMLALTLHNGAYVTEIIRAGIESIHRGQMEAARSLGLTYLQAMRKVILPQAFRQVLPPLTNSFIDLLKATSLVSVIGFVELLKQGRQLQNWLANSTPLTGAAILYFVMLWPLIRLAGRLEARLGRGRS
ncbi:MAG: amino acid ABC transporter permease [Anaerolineae bacterium]